MANAELFGSRPRSLSRAPGDSAKIDIFPRREGTRVLIAPTASADQSHLDTMLWLVIAR